MKYIAPAALILVQSCCARTENDIDTDEKFKNVVQQWMWKGAFPNVLRGNKELNKENKWIQDSYYDESVYCVISKALADCQMRMNSKILKKTIQNS